MDTGAHQAQRTFVDSRNDREGDMPPREELFVELLAAPVGAGMPVGAIHHALRSRPIAASQDGRAAGVAQRNRTDVIIHEPSVRAFRAGFRGDILGPGDPEYDDARRVFNRMIDRRPALIACARNAQDVRRAVLFAREHALPLSVKGGGHNVAGSAVCDDGLVVDCALMKGIQVDPERRVAVAQPGLLLGEVDAATQTFGLATPLGTASITGISGLTLGGGIGWLNGMHGLACDNVVAADVVTADGELLRASATEHPDLYWAIRGGSGNFGIVTSFVYALHSVARVWSGTLAYPPEQSRDALRFYHEFSQTCPDELSTIANLATDDAGRTVVAVAYSWCGTLHAGERALRTLRAFGNPTTDVVEMMDYCALQRVIDDRFPAGRQHYWKSNFLTDFSEEAIDVMLHFAAERPSPAPVHGAIGPSRSGIGFQHVHGAAARVDPAATAFPHRHAHHDFLILAQWTDPADAEPHIAWTRAFFEAMRPFTERAVYVNGLGVEGEDRVREAYGANYPRLAAIKGRYDPTNLFRANQNIQPLT
jgi:FAD/FMN-containing dehydrogenase